MGSAYKKGFTLIEVIVVLAVFLLVIGASISIFISMLQRQKQMLSQQEIINEISYAQEYMSKALRVAKTATSNADANCLGTANVGYSYLLTRYTAADGFYHGIKFINPSDDGACEEFFIDNLVTGDTSTSLVLKQLKNSANDNAAVPLTSDKLTINSIRFGINGTDGSAVGMGCNPQNSCGASEKDSVQPRITIVINVTLKSGGQSVTKMVQTTVSQRNLNVKS